jgi:hypothetical protein
MRRTPAIGALLAAGLLSCLPLHGQGTRVEQAPLWRLDPDVSFASFSLGFTPVDAGIEAADILSAMSGGWFKVGYGLSLDDDYYLLIPERETAFSLKAGYAAYGAEGSSFDPTGTGAPDTSSRDYGLAYASIELEQVLAGDRNHTGAWLLASLSDESRWVSPSAPPGGSLAPEPFFAHRPRAELSFNVGPRNDFWSVASLSGSAGAQIEAGHSASRPFWAFAAADASLSFKLPLAGQWLYLSGAGSCSAYLAGLTGAAGIPAYYYTAYSTPASVSVDADLRSRILRFDPMVPMGLDIGVGASSSAAGEGLLSMDYGELLQPTVRAYVELSIQTIVFGDLRLRAGAGMDPATLAVSPIVMFVSE